MDTVTQRIKDLFGRYKYVLMVIGLGLAFMLIPSEREQPQVAPVQKAQAADTMQESLERILGNIQGVGAVKVLLTEAQGERNVYVFDQSSSNAGESVKSDAVIITDGNRTQSGMIAQVIPPVYLGAVIVCQGGDQPRVQLAVVEAVSNATGLSADKISVLKMK